MTDTQPDDLPGVIEDPSGTFHYDWSDRPRDDGLIPTLCGLTLPDYDEKPDWWAQDEPPATCPTCLAKFTELTSQD